MDDFFTILLAIIIETLFYCTIPLIIRLIKKEPFDKKKAWYISIANYGIMFVVSKLIASHLINIDYNQIGPDVFSALLVFVNFYILRYEKHEKVNQKENKKYININKKVLIIIPCLLFVAALFIIISTNNNNNDYSVKNIKSQKAFDKVISNKDYSIVYFYFDGCVFCDISLPIFEELIEEYRIVNAYKYNISNGMIDAKVDLYEFPTIVIYKNKNFVDQKTGYTNQQELAKQFYRLEIIELLSNHNIID